MALRSFLIVFLLSVVLVATTIDGRKGPVEYWKEMTGDQPMPEAHIMKESVHFHNPNEKSIIKDFDPAHYDVSFKLIAYKTGQSEVKSIISSPR